MIEQIILFLLLIILALLIVFGWVMWIIVGNIQHQCYKIQEELRLIKKR